MTPAPFTEDQVQRYSRHIILPNIGGAGQRRLLDAKVLVIGAGGLGSPVLLYLAAAGVGTIGVVDFDRELGLVHHVGMRGRATVEPFDPQRATRLLARYLGDRSELWDGRFRATLADSDNLFVRFVPESVVARDQSYERPPKEGEEPRS
jgi:adenylyltransferase/sulfurtransferase